MAACYRGVKPGGYVILTHRSDQIGNWKGAIDICESNNLWKTLSVSEPLPYLPGNVDYADKIKCHLCIYKITKQMLSTINTAIGQ
eukprot:gene1056-736_t